MEHHPTWSKPGNNTKPAGMGVEDRPKAHTLPVESAAIPTHIDVIVAHIEAAVPREVRGELAPEVDVTAALGEGPTFLLRDIRKRAKKK